MSMRSVIPVLLLTLCAVGAARASPDFALARTPASSAVQSLVLGDIDCGDQEEYCSFPSTVPGHRYLHAVLHDVPGNEDWQIQWAPTCSDTPATLVQGLAVGRDGYLEVVADLETAVPGKTLVSVAGCFILRGRNGWGVTYYAVYFDDTSQSDAEAVYPGYTTLGGRPDLTDLDVTYIHRAPELKYDSPHNLPSAGEQVVFYGHVRNVGGVPAPPFHFTWLLDGNAVSEGTYPGPLFPGGGVPIPFRWRWDGRPHELALEVNAGVPEIGRDNNRLAIRTDALALGFWVERSAYQYFFDHQWVYCRDLPCRGSVSFEDWLERQIRAWNALMGNAVDPLYAPAGIGDRVRVDEVVVVPDGALPLHGSSPTATPDLTDHTVDLEWGLPARGVAQHFRRGWEGPFDVDWATIHELNHARSLADLYRFDIPLTSRTEVGVKDVAGASVVDMTKPFDPSNKLPAFSINPAQSFLYLNREQDLMSCTCMPRYSPYSAMVVNRLRGRRARCGNTNAPCNIGDWFADIPPVNLLKIQDAGGVPVPDGTMVTLYFDGSTGYTSHTFNPAASSTLTVHSGTVSLGPDPFRSGGRASLAGHNLLLIEVHRGADDAFCFQEPTTFNIAYWTGYRDAAHPAVYTLRGVGSGHNDCGLSLPPALINEPFATSPYASSVSIGRPNKGRRGRFREVTVRLRDDAKPAHAMRNRLIRALDSHGKVVATGQTGDDGESRFRISAATSLANIVDITDNDLVIPVRGGSPPP